MPISQILPDGKVRIFNKTTGQTADVKPEELGSYSPTLVGEYQNIVATRDAIKSGQLKTSDAPKELSTQVASALTASGYSPAKAAKESAADQARHDNIQAAISSLNASEQNLAAGGGAQGPLGATANIPLLGQWLNPSGAAYNKTKIETATQLAKAITNSARPGQAVTDAYIHSLPEVTDNPEHAKQKIALMRNQLMQQAKDFKYQDLLDGEAGTPPPPAIQNKAQNNQPNLGSNIVNNGKDVLNSILGIPAQAVQTVRDATTNPDPKKRIAAAGSLQLGNILGNAGKNYIQGLNKDLGEPLQGGDIAGRIGSNAYNRPVNTALDILPFLGGALGKVLPRGVNAADTATLPEQVTTVANKPNLLQQALRVHTDAINGGGSKQYIARTTGKETAIPQNQALMDEGILLHPTETGRIKATQGAINKNGAQLGSVYENSDRHFTGQQLNEKLDVGLREKGYDQKSVDYIKSYIANQGGLDLSSGDSLVTMKQAWTGAKNLENNPPKMLKNPESAAGYKKLSGDAARIIRQSLGEKLPETKALNAKYSALRDYMDNILPDKATGIKINGISSAVDLPAQAAKNTANVTQNALYKALGVSPRKLVRDNRSKLGNVLFRKAQ